MFHGDSVGFINPCHRFPALTPRFENVHMHILPTRGTFIAKIGRRTRRILPTHDLRSSFLVGVRLLLIVFSGG